MNVLAIAKTKGGVGPLDGEIATLDIIEQDLGDKLGTEPGARNALIRFAARQPIADYREGKLDLLQYFENPEKPKPRIKL